MGQSPFKRSDLGQDSQESSLCFTQGLELDGVTLSEVSTIETAPEVLKLPMMGIPIQAGFPSPSDDYVEQSLDLNQFMIAHPSATYFVRVVGDSMIEAHIQENDYLVVDRAIAPSHNAIVIAVVNGELTLKRLYRQGGLVELRAENPAYPAIRITGDMELVIWGVVSGIFRKV
ncbi:LexA family protein [Lyngbya confervoides]|uniref:Translesion error-prone DNA polymerase V autoproteolytic subunit n=1 Tax=Lyngbya confervoides BDU141951 TaxID=1574623 RepID=A0ABD4SZ45_9CYAN|nr:translesion error-prone DNA polymerase V autoproteolytic subunit [Lyngbya confervoides]MCM1981554.1 translesion error-prone DNA polymerase V autoproteolytic subunit [Lyngbya confervoides BDU141951]